MATDAELLRESRRRPDAYVEVCSRHMADLARWLRHEVGQDAADDLLAETLARGWYSRRRFRDPGTGSAGAWLQGIAANLVRDFRRRGAIEHRARAKLGLPLSLEDATGYLEADDQAEAVSRYAAVRERLDELPLDQREALELRVVHELDYDEIGERLSVSPVTARTRVHRALKALRVATAGKDE
jgi:RNA polymerase sigma factor (sigma-70 family)